MKTLLLSILISISTIGLAQNFEWVKDLSENTTSSFEVVDIETGPDDNIYLLINYTENFDLIPGPSQVTVTNHGGMDCLVAVYKPDGTYLDYYNIFKTAGTTNDPFNSDEQAFDMTVTDSRVFVVGRFERDFYFQIQNQSSEIYVGDFANSLFVAQLDIASAGGIQYAWATTPLSSSDMDPSDFEDTKIYYNPSDGDLYLSGRFYGSFDFSSSSSLSTNDGEGDIFFGKVDGGNGDYLWAKALKAHPIVKNLQQVF